jgi:hypothetical protein
LLRAEGLWYTDEEDEADFDACTIVADAITARWVALCVEMARALHASGAIAQRFGRRIPIIVHELEYYPKIAEQTAAANPPGVATEFVAWIEAM